jgi:hypothetical protein
MKEVVILLLALIPTLGLVFWLIKRGISKKYDRKAPSPWSALNEGIDPSQ